MKSQIEFKDPDLVNMVNNMNYEEQLEQLRNLSLVPGWLVFEKHVEQLIKTTKIMMAEIKKEEFDEYKGMIKGMEKIAGLVRKKVKRQDIKQKKYQY